MNGLRPLARAARERAYMSLGMLPFAIPRLAITSGECGLFGDAFMALNGLRLSERAGLDARIVWDERSLYHDPAHGPNVWEYYFESADAAYGPRRATSGFLTYKPPATDFVPYCDHTVRQSVHRMIGRHMRLRPEVAARIDSFVAEQFTFPAMLGLHIRLTDVARGEENRYQIAMPDYLAEVDDWLAAHPDSGVFAATDDAPTLAMLRDRYGDRIVAQDCMRSTDGSSIHGHYDGGVAGSSYRKGLEVVTDAWLLARTDHLVCSHSRVTCFALCIDPEMTYVDLGVKKYGIDRSRWLTAPARPCGKASA